MAVAVDTACAMGVAVSANATAVSLHDALPISVDSDATTNTVSYSLSNSDGGRFAIDATTGVVTTDRKSTRLDSGHRSRTNAVRCSSTDNSTAETTLTLAIGDGNEFAVTAPVDT